MITRHKTKLQNKRKPWTDMNRFCYSGHIVLLCKNTFRKYQKLPPALVLVSSPETPEDTVEKIFITIGKAITRSSDTDCPETVTTLIERILRLYKIQIGPGDVRTAIWYGIDKGSLIRRELSEALYTLVGDTTLDYADKLISSSSSSSSTPSSSPSSTPRGSFLDPLTPEGTITNTPIASNSELPSSSSASPSSNLSQSSSSINEEHSFLSSVGTYISEHKVLIIASVAAVVVVGTIVYILWKRRGPTPPTGHDLTPSTESDQNSTPVTSDIVSKMIYIGISLSMFFALYYPLINNNISHAL